MLGAVAMGQIPSVLFSIASHSLLFRRLSLVKNGPSYGRALTKMISQCTAPPVFSQQHCTIIVVIYMYIPYIVVCVCLHHIVIACMGLLSVIHNDPGVLVKHQ